MLLALACGLAIMLAGAVMLFRLSQQDAPAEPVAVGEQVEVGDMRVTVLAVDERDGALEVAVRIGGVDDPDGALDFRLIASGRQVPAAGGGTCGATTSTDQDCTISFDVSSADGASRVLFYERGDEQQRWVLG